MLIDPLRDYGKQVFVHYRAGLAESNGNPVQGFTRAAYFLGFDGKQVRLQEQVNAVARQNMLGVLGFETNGTTTFGILAPLYGNCAFLNGKDRVVNGQRYFAFNEPIKLVQKSRQSELVVVVTEMPFSKLDDLIRRYSPTEAPWQTRRGRQ